MKKCTHINKHGKPCGNYEARNGSCLYHQPEERRESLKHKEQILARRLEDVRRELTALENDGDEGRPASAESSR